MTYDDDDGCLVLKSRMPADQGEVIVKALEAAMDEAFDPEKPMAETLRAGWYAGDRMDMDPAVWLLSNARGPD